MPPHVHVRNADGEARFTLQTVACIENNGLKNKDLYLAEAMIEEISKFFLTAGMIFLKTGMKFFEYKAAKAWLTATDIFVALEDGRQASLPLSDFLLLLKASPEERKKKF